MEGPDRAGEELLERLEASLGPVCSGQDRPIVLFSGGLDSSLLAHLLTRSGGRADLRTVGRRGSNDLVAAREGAEHLGASWQGVELSDAALEEAWARYRGGLAAEPEPRRSVLFSLAVAFEACPAGAVVVGQGADELFGGYRHFEGLSPAAAVRRSDEDLRRLLEHDWPATESLARPRGLRLVAPFLDPGFLAATRRLDPPVRFSAPPAKRYLRVLARRAGLPVELADRPKRALQYGTGIAAWLRRRTGSTGAAH
jgi:asparagine synthase (glutamine-hydrolysing)